MAASAAASAWPWRLSQPSIAALAASGSGARWVLKPGAAGWWHMAQCRANSAAPSDAGGSPRTATSVGSGLTGVGTGRPYRDQVAQAQRYRRAPVGAASRTGKRAGRGGMKRMILAEHRSSGDPSNPELTPPPPPSSHMIGIEDAALSAAAVRSSDLAVFSELLPASAGDLVQVSSGDRARGDGVRSA